MLSKENETLKNDSHLSAHQVLVTPVPPDSLRFVTPSLPAPIDFVTPAIPNPKQLDFSTVPEVSTTANTIDQSKDLVTDISTDYAATSDFEKTNNKSPVKYTGKKRGRKSTSSIVKRSKNDPENDPENDLDSMLNKIDLIEKKLVLANNRISKLEKNNNSIAKENTILANRMAKLERTLDGTLSFNTEYLERLKKQDKTIQNISNDLNKYKLTIPEVSNQISILRDEQRNLKEFTCRNNGDTVANLSNQSDSALHWSKYDKQIAFNITKVVKEETRKLEKKENNIVIFGLSNNTSNSPTDLVNKLFNDLDLKLKIVNLKRLKPNNDQATSPIIVELGNKADKFKTLKASKALRQNLIYKSVYIKPDLTKEEQLSEKKNRKDRDELNQQLRYGTGHSKYDLFKFENSGKEEKFYWGIRDDKLKRIKIKENNITEQPQH